MDVKHTPLPWAHSLPHLIFKDSQGVVDFNQPIAATGDDKKGLENAAFIVRACNVHYELVEALEEMCQLTHTPSEKALKALAKARGE